MTKAQAIAHLKAEQNVTDVHISHARADDVLCGLLRSINYGDVVDEWEKIVLPGRCELCGKPQDHSTHIKWGNDLDNPLKHEFKPNARREFPAASAGKLDGVVGSLDSET